MNIIVDAVNSSLMNPDDCGDSKTASVRRWWHLLKAICWDSNEGGYWLARTFPLGRGDSDVLDEGEELTGVSSRPAEG